MSKPTIRDRRHFLAGATALSAAAMLPWPGSLWAAAEATRGGRLRISVDQAVNVLNPLMARVNPEYLVAELLYSGLTRLSAEMDAEPDLAESWQANDTLTEWTFRLREGVVFHDGSACTAEDAAASLRAILDPANAAPGRRNIGPIIAIEVPDPHTLVLRTDQPFADLPVTLTHPTAKVVPRAIAEQGLDRLAREAIGCGPFVLERFEPERQVVVSRNPRYYDAERPYLEGVEVRVYPDPTAEGSALIAGDIDMMLPPKPLSTSGWLTPLG